jgi:hypothetical protein
MPHDASTIMATRFCITYHQPIASDTSHKLSTASAFFYATGASIEVFAQDTLWNAFERSLGSVSDFLYNTYMSHRRNCNDYSMYTTKP